MRHLFASLLLLAATCAAATEIDSAVAAEQLRPPAGVSEHAVTVGSGDWAVRGMVTMPTRSHPVPGVVLVHGSGPGTLDMNVGGSTIYRDLAWGLAQRGIAVIRYEKRTTQHRARFKALKRPASLREEFIEDASSAGRILQQTPGVDPARMFVFGNSQGGVLAPGIANDLGFAGAIVMSGSPRSVGDIILQQTDYVAKTSASDPEAVKRAAEFRAGALRLKAIASETDPDAIILGNPVWYWRDMLAVAPVDEIRRLTSRRGRALVMQGERDYLVTDTDWAAWQAALKDERGVTLRLYPRLNHIMQDGEGKMTPAEYAWSRPVSPVFIDDLASWINDDGASATRK